jgi:hypothetical protein
MEKEEQQCVDHDQETISGNTTDVVTDANMEKSSAQERQSDDSVTTLEAELPEHEYATGVKLVLIIASVTLVSFLMMLDMSIIATVGFHIVRLKVGKLLIKVKGYSSDHQ